MVVEDARHTVLIKRSCGDSFYCQLCKKVVDGGSKEHLESKGHTRKATGAVTSVSLSPKSTLGLALGKVVTLHGSTFCVDPIEKDASNAHCPKQTLSCRVCDVFGLVDFDAAHVHASSKKHTEAVARSLSPASKAIVRFKCFKKASNSRLSVICVINPAGPEVVPVQKAEEHAASHDTKHQHQDQEEKPEDKFECTVCERVMGVSQRDAQLADKSHAAAITRQEEANPRNNANLAGKRHLKAEERSRQGHKMFHCAVCVRVMGVRQRDAHLAGRPHAAAVRRQKEPSKMIVDDQWSKRKRHNNRHRRRNVNINRVDGDAGCKPDCHAIKPDCHAMNAFLDQAIHRLLPYPLPPDLRSLFSEEFPSIEELYASRRQLSEIGREMLRAVFDYNPFIASISSQETTAPTDAHTTSNEVMATSERPNDKPKTAVELFARGTKAVREVLSLCLQLEETALAIELSAYNKEGVIINEDSVTQGNFRLHSVEMPGVSENRPSVLRGDRILVYSDDTHNNTGKSFVGYVHFVNDDNIVMSLNRGFAEYVRLIGAALDCSIVFQQNRSQERKIYRALEKIPSNCILTRNEALREIDFTAASPVANTLLTDFGAELNDEQRSFVEGVRGPKRLCALWGPPGTGKTTAMVAAIYDTYTRRMRKGAKVAILVSAPSNEAADLLAERLLLELKKDPQNTDLKEILLRLPALTRDPKLIKGELIHYCPMETIDGSFSFPPKEELEEFPIIVTTLMTADRLYAVGCQKFTHFFVDEAGHASEQLLLVGLNAACDEHTKIVLAGDPMQLGPRFNTPLLLETGLATSPLSRFVEDNSLWEAIGHQLISSYRCHIDIIRLINVSYEEKLISARTEQDHEETRRKIAPLWRTDLLRGFWGSHCGLHPEADPHLLNRAHQREKKDQAEFVPRTVLAINHTYPESREKDSPSWMNTFEIQTVVDLCKTLFFEKIITSFHEVAIITPYRKQRTAIEARLYSTMLNDVELRDHMESFETKKGIRLRVPMKVATVDSFQGREARVVIVSCVRSNMKVACNDSKFGLGFLGQPTRANVALSRAKDLLIIVGNRTVLTNDATWSRYFERIDELGEGAYMDLGGPQIVSGELSDESTDENNGNMLGLETVAERTVE